MRYIHILFFIFLQVYTVNSQKIDKILIPNELDNQITQHQLVRPNIFSLVQISPIAWYNYLSVHYIESKNVTIELPNENGEIEKYDIFPAPVMAHELCKKYNHIKSFKGYNQNDKNTTVRLSITPDNFHAVIRNNHKTIYIDPYSSKSNSIYITYNIKDDEESMRLQNLMCGTSSHSLGDRPKWGVRQSPQGTPFQLRKYRLALACTGEWGALRGTKERIIEDMVTFVERANIVFEAEIGITLELINRNDELIHLDGTTDGYENPQTGASLVGQNTTVLNIRIGSNAYDIGHVLSPCFDVGGIAGGVACSPGKGAGVTCQNGINISNGTVLVFNHEVGHQLTASHTFNRCGDTDQLALGTGFEPGSGSTIMSYAGACGSDNLGIARGSYYHSASIEQMLGFTNIPSSDAYVCAEKIEYGNFSPEINLKYTTNIAIPHSTPFYLEGQASDANDDPLTYIWEQFDNQVSVPLGTVQGNCPLFRSLPPSPSPIRFFPNTSDILNGSFFNKTERLPDYGRDLNFRFIVRDNNLLGTSAVWEDVKFRVAGNAGPFKITYPNLDQRFDIGQSIDVTWDVANTNLAPVNCKNVDIYMCINDRLSFEDGVMLPLRLNTANDGHAKIVIPDTVANRVRIVIKGTDNIFLTTSIIQSRILEPTTPSIYMETDKSEEFLCLPASTSVQMNTKAFAGLTDSIRYVIVENLPTGITAEFDQNISETGATNQVHFNLDNIAGENTFSFTIRAYVPGVDTIDREFILTTKGNNLAGISGLLPIDNSEGIGATQRYEWSQIDDANQYQIQVSISPAFENESIVINRTVTDVFLNSNTFLEKAKVYYWRVRPINDCKEGEWSSTKAFITEAQLCQIVESGPLSINISPSGLPVVEYETYVPLAGNISDINIPTISGTHQRVGDIEATLISPQGTEVLLWSKKCGTSKNFNVGLDDDSNKFFQCPINISQIYRPEEPLSKYNGEPIEGLWTLILKDLSPGEGGRLENVVLEFCSNISLNPPFLIRNDTLLMPPLEERTIDDILLETADNDTPPSDLIYTLVSQPVHGSLNFKGDTLSIGDTFSQEELSTLGILYRHNDEQYLSDYFSFTIIDGAGGWIGITNFNITIDPSLPTKTYQYDSKIPLKIYPNPNRGNFTIEIDDDIHIFDIQIITLDGKLIHHIQGPKNTNPIQLNNVASGVYIIKVNTEIGIINKKVLIQQP